MNSDPAKTGTMVNVDEIQFDQRGLIPVVVQDQTSGQVLMVAYANHQAVTKTINTGYAHFYSRSRQELWKKGATSGNLQRVHDIRVDCDADALLYLVDPYGPACHTGATSCFFRSLEGPPKTEAADEAADTDEGSASALEVLSELFAVIESRKHQPVENSYVARLLNGSWDAALRKVGEEATEVMLAAVEPKQPKLVPEVADLWFHTLIVLAQHDRSLQDVLAELQSRRR